MKFLFYMFPLFLLWSCALLICLMYQFLTIPFDDFNSFLANNMKFIHKVRDHKMEQNLTVDLSAFFNSGITPIDLSKNTNFSGFYSLKQAESLKVIKVPL